MSDDERVRPAEGRLFRPGSQADGDGLRPVARLCDLILGEALVNKATQVRLAEYEQDGGAVEYLIDDQWRQVMKVPTQAHRQVINRLKVMAGLESSRKPMQSGQLHFSVDTKVRVLEVSVEALSSGSDIGIITIDAAAT